MARQPRRNVNDGVGRVRPLNEGVLNKGGMNSPGRFTERPPAPAALRPTSATNGGSANGNSSNGTSGGSKPTP